MGDDRRFQGEHSPETTRWMASFESAWDSGEPPDIAQFLSPVEPSVSAQVLFEFVRVDLTHRWQLAARRESNGVPGAAPRDILQPLSLDEYTARFPTLAAEDRRLLELILHEYRLRKAYGSAPDPQAYVHRYGQRFEELAESLRSIDRQLDDETVDVSVEQPAQDRPELAVRHGATTHRAMMAATRRHFRQTITPAQSPMRSKWATTSCWRKSVAGAWVLSFGLGSRH